MATKKNAVGQDQATSTDAIQAQKKTMLFMEAGSISPLIQNCFSQKTFEDLLRTHMGLGGAKEKKKPSDLIERAKIFNDDGVICLPATSVKKAMITAAGMIKSLKMQKTNMKITMFVVGQSIPITFESMTPRMDMVRNANGNPDIRFRPQFNNWGFSVGIEYDDGMFNVRTVMDLFNRAGQVGVGEWRPERNGTYGMFELKRCITDKKEVEKIIKACRAPVRAPVIPSWAMDVPIDMEVLKKMQEDALTVEDDATPAAAPGRRSRAGAAE